jgi:hypothetical protein
LLYLFSGPHGLPGGLDEAAAHLELSIVFVDLEVSPKHDICDDTFLEGVISGIQGGSSWTAHLATVQHF